MRDWRALWWVVLLWPAAAAAEPAYVTDTVSVAVFSGRELSGDPLERLLSGSLVTVLENAGGKARVRLDSGVEGWMRSSYLTAAVPAAVKLEDALIQLDQVQEALAEANETIAKLEKSAEGAKDIGWLRAELSKARTRAEQAEHTIKTSQTNSEESQAQLDAMRQALDEVNALNEELFMKLATAEMIESDTAIARAGASAGHNWIITVLSVMTAAAVFAALGFASGFWWLDRRIRQRFGGVRIR